VFKQLASAAVILSFATHALAAEKKRIEKAADLPRFSYHIDGKLEDLVRDETRFRNFAAQVRRDDESVDANGYQVESWFPGGEKVALSGASMASPEVANLAGKILAVNPRLTPPRVIQIIVRTAERTPDGRRALIDPAKAVAAAQEHAS